MSRQNNGGNALDGQDGDMRESLLDRQGGGFGITLDNLW